MSHADTPEQVEIAETLARSAAFRATINRRLKDESIESILAEPNAKNRIIRRKLLTTVLPDPLLQANAEVVMADIEKLTEVRRMADSGKTDTSDLKIPEKNSTPIRDLFRITASGPQVKRAMQSFVVRREFSRRLREGAPDTTPEGVITEGEFRQLQSDMAAHHLKEKEAVNADQ